MMRVLLVGLAIGAGVSVAASSEKPIKITCPHHEEFPVSFTEWDSNDVFAIDLLGTDCAKAVRVVTIRTANGYPIFTHSARFQQLAAQPLSYNDVLQETLASIRKSISGKRSSEIPEFGSLDVDPENFYQGGEENRENYNRGRVADKPVMCLRIGYEYWECYWYDQDKRSVKYLYGVGA